MTSVRYEFIMSQVKTIRDIKETEKVKISLIFYEGAQSTCILKICKNRDLSEVYQSLMEVRHPNLATVYDCVYENGNTYVIEEYIHGKTIAEILAVQGVFSEEETIRIMKELCEGLEALHQQMPPVIHNDIKASNIMLREDGSVKIFDFDISRLYKDGSNKNTRLMGTHEYAAPEHYGFGQSEPCTDIYSLGVTMHEMLTGAGLDHEHQVTYKGRLEGIIRKCVEIDRKKRYPTATLLKADLERVQKETKPKRYLAIGVLCSVLFLGIAGVLFQGVIGSEPGKTDEPKTEVAMSEGNSDVVEDLPEKPVNSETESEEVIANADEMQIVCPIQGTFLAMDAWTDGIFLHAEEISGNYFLKSSNGKEKQLQEVSVAYGAQLECNPYTNKMYLILFDYGTQLVYEVTKDLEITLIATYHEEEKTSAFVAFYSDGTMVYDSNHLNSNDWSYIGSKFLGTSPYLINGKTYSFEASEFGVNLEFVFLERGEDGSLLNAFPLKKEGISFLDYQNPRAVYGDSKAAYFIGVKEEKNYIYRFDGTTYEAMKCLNDDPNFVLFGYEELCVAKNKVRCYSYPHRAIVEFIIK